MNETVWTKNVKEGFIENMQKSKQSGNGNTCSGNVSSDSVQFISSAVANFGNEVYIGKDINELILTSDPNMPMPTPNPESPEDETGSSFDDIFNDLYKDFNLNKAKNIYKNGIRTIKKKVDNVKHDIAGSIAGWFYDNFESPEAKKDLEILSSQISIWIVVIPMSYLVVINWWYVLAYTNYIIDFRDYIFYAFYWPMAPAFHAFELLNYYTLTFRMDIDSRFPTIETSRNWIWNYRSIWFSLFHLVTFLPMLIFPVTDIMESTMMNSGAIFAIASIVAVYYFFSLFMKERWYDKFMNSGLFGYLFLLAMTIVSFLMMFMFITIMCPIFLLYTLFLSYLVIFAFNGFWPPSIISVYKQIFQELKEVPVYEKSDKFGKMSNFVLQNFHSIYLLIIMSGFFIENVRQSMKFSNDSLIAIAIIANILICLLFAPSAVTVPFELLNVFLDDTDEEKPNKIQPGEASINVK